METIQNTDAINKIIDQKKDQKTVSTLNFVLFGTAAITLVMLIFGLSLTNDELKNMGINACYAGMLSKWSEINNKIPLAAIGNYDWIMVFGAGALIMALMGFMLSRDLNWKIKVAPLAMCVLAASLLFAQAINIQTIKFNECRALTTPEIAKSMERTLSNGRIEINVSRFYLDETEMKIKEK